MSTRAYIGQLVPELNQRTTRVCCDKEVSLLPVEDRLASALLLSFRIHRQIPRTTNSLDHQQRPSHEPLWKIPRHKLTDVELGDSSMSVLLDYLSPCPEALATGILFGGRHCSLQVHMVAIAAPGPPRIVVPVNTPRILLHELMNFPSFFRSLKLNAVQIAPAPKAHK